MWSDDEQRPRQDSIPSVHSDSSQEEQRGDRSSSEQPRPNTYLWPGSDNALNCRSPIDPLSPDVADRVFPIRSAVSVDPNATPSHRSDTSNNGYFTRPSYQGRRFSITSDSDHKGHNGTSTGRRGGSAESRPNAPQDRQPSSNANHQQRHSAQLFNELASSRHDNADNHSTESRDTRPQPSDRALSTKNVRGMDEADIGAGLMTARFKHVVSEGGHAIITGRDGDTLQRCEDEPIHIPGAVQGFGLLIALEEETEGKLIVRVVSENSKRLIGYTPKQLFALDSFTDILSEDQTDNLLDHVDFIRDEEADVNSNGPEVFTMSIRTPQRKLQKLWCGMHITDKNPGLIICEFELEDDPLYPLVPNNEGTPELPEDTLASDPTADEYAESTEIASKPLRVLRSARKRKGEAAAMEVFNVMSQVQEQLASAPNLDQFLKILVGVVKELTGFHRVMVYQFDAAWNGRVVTELVDPRATKDLYKGLNFPASDIPKQARELYKVNKVRMLYDRDHETARLVCRTVQDLEKPLDLTYSYLRAMSPIHIKYLANMAVRSSMSISINAFDELWGLVSCHAYGSKGTRVSFPIRKMCRLVGETASRNIERLSYASRLQARKLINTVPTSKNPSGYIIASSEDLLKLFDADFGMLSIKDETKVLGHVDETQEALALLEYLRLRRLTAVTATQDLKEEFPDLRYSPGFHHIAGLLVVPLSSGGNDFIVFFRRGQLREVKWAGNPYEKFVKEGTEGYLEPRKSFKTWSETVVGKCRDWTEEEIETAAVLCLVYGKFIEVWRQKEVALKSSELTRLLLANSAHEVRTPLNAIINYLEIALEGNIDDDTRESLTKSHSASKSLIYVINDLLDLTKTEEGASLTKEEPFSLSATLKDATEQFAGDARRKKLSYDVVEHPGLPATVIGDQRKVRQAISNVTANAIQNTKTGGISIEMYSLSREDGHVEVEITITDTGCGMNNKKLDTLFRELEQVQSEVHDMLDDKPTPNTKQVEGESGEKRTIGLGLAVVARIVRNMNGQLRLKSVENKGSRFTLQLPFDLPTDGQKTLEGSISEGSQHSTLISAGNEGEITLVERGNQRRNSVEHSLSRTTSNESIQSRRSLPSMKSGRSRASEDSTRSEADRLIDAISSPVDNRRGPPNRGKGNSGSQRPSLGSRHSTSALPSSLQARQPRSTNNEMNPQGLTTQVLKDSPGRASVMDQGRPIKAVRVPEETDDVPPAAQDQPQESSRVLGEHQEVPPDTTDEAPTADHMRVLVAEDDPVNSRIIKKRLEKMGHEVYLTTNGEECSSMHGDKSGYFDVVLMDMQVRFEIQPTIDIVSLTFPRCPLLTDSQPPKSSAHLRNRILHIYSRPVHLSMVEFLSSQFLLRYLRGSSKCMWTQDLMVGSSNLFLSFDYKRS
jgi:light-regulated signal transduction histidine kinase (bacteriophytochrome)